MKDNKKTIATYISLNGSNIIIHILYGILTPTALYVFIEIIKKLFFLNNFLINYQNIFILYLLTIVISTLRFGLISGVASAILSFIIINYFYIHQGDNPDMLNLSVLVNFLLFVGIGAAVGVISYTANLHKIESLAKEKALKVINTITLIKSSAIGIEDLAILICHQLEEELKSVFKIILKNNNGSITAYGDLELDDKYKDEIQHNFSNIKPHIFYGSNKVIFFQPIFALDRNIGILITESSPKNNIVILEKILPTISDQISIILENFKSRLMLNESRLNAEKEKLRSLILSSISHDLKTPLCGIISSLSIYNKLSKENKLSNENKAELISTALEEAERLSQFISEILEMTKIESGAITLKKQLFTPDSVIEKTLKRFALKLQDYKLEIALNQKIQINFDLISFEQIMQNLIDNSTKYSAKNTKISIHDEVNGDNYKIFIKDEGIGIEPSKLELIFNKFERFTLEDKVSGSGLGLSIVKALMEANSASISASNITGEKGTIFTLVFNDFEKLI